MYVKSRKYNPFRENTLEREVASIVQKKKTNQNKGDMGKMNFAVQFGILNNFQRDSLNLPGYSKYSSTLLAPSSKRCW